MIPISSRTAPVRTSQSIIAALILLLLPTLQAATGTLLPAPWFYAYDSNGNPVSGAKACFYTAGTSTPSTTYSDVNLTTPNTNPVVADSAGRVGPVYLTPGQSYKLILQDATGTALTCDGAVIRTQDNIAAVPTSSANLDVLGTAGEALSAGQVVYLSDGSASKTAGQWYKADAAQSYSSVVPHIGMVPTAISSGQQGSIRLAGQMTGLTVSVGSTYYIGTAGAITATAPVQARIVGVADSASTLLLPKTPIPVLPWVNDFRLTLTTGTPVTTADVTAATTIYASPYSGNRIDLPDSSGNPIRVTSAEFSIAVPASTSQMYDVFAYNNAGVATLELLAWTNDTTRATAIVRTNGRWMKSGDSTRLYLGSCRTTTVSGQTEDSATKRYLWNYYNRASRLLEKTVAGSTSWTYTTATIRQANATATNQVEAVVGVADLMVDLTLQTVFYNTAATLNVQIGIGVDSTTTFATPGGAAVAILNNSAQQIFVRYQAYPTVGRHVYSWNEWGQAGGGNTTWNNSAGGANNASGGISGSYPG